MMKATVRDLAKLRAMGLVAGDAGKEVISLAVCNGDGLRRETSDFSLELHCNCYLSILPCTRGMCPQLHLSTASSLASRQGSGQARFVMLCQDHVGAEAFRFQD